VAPRRVVFHPEADREIERAHAWYEERSPSAAEGFLDEVDHAIGQVQNAPERWARYLAQTRRFVCNRYPYSLIYRLQGDLVKVLAVAHEKQREGYWIGRR
jgi:toxin ParE1/3/4